jgi:NAD(P)-dependent dehydrogenase (short-subunit alcohol dehydrogenase family)
VANNLVTRRVTSESRNAHAKRNHEWPRDDRYRRKPRHRRGDRTARRHARLLGLSTKRGGRGAIVNVSSGAARLGSPGEYVDYAASKGAVDTMTIGLAREVATEGIRVNAVRAGFIYTDIHASGGEPDRVDRVKAFAPMKRGGTAKEVAQAVLWLLSDDASFTTGAFVDVTGGL